MKTNRDTTFILLERDDEDVAMYKELLKFKEICFDHYKSSHAIFKEFPILNNLRQKLNNELVDQDYYIK